MANSVDPDQTAPLWTGSTLFGQACVSENLGTLQYVTFDTVVVQQHCVYPSKKNVKLIVTCKKKNIWAASWQNQQNDCAPSQDSDQPGHPPSLIRVFAVRSVGS